MSARIALIAMALLGARVSQAADVRGTFSTVLAAREAARNGQAVSAVPLYELIALEVSDLAIPGTELSRVVLQGWGRLQVGDDELRDTDADLSLMFLELHTGRYELRAGRQYLSEGVGRMSMIDGANGKAWLPGGFAVQAFAGATVHPQLRHRTGNWQFGGRASWSFHETLGKPGVIGVGYRQRRHRGDIRTDHLGADASLILGATHWSAIAVMDPTMEALVEGRVAMSLRANENWLITFDAERIRPDLLIPLSSIFSVFADSNHDSLGFDAGYTPSPYYEVDVAMHLLRLDGDNLGHRLLLRGITYREPSHRSFIGAEVRQTNEYANRGPSSSDAPAQGYVSARAFTKLQLLESLGVSADLFLYDYDEEINGTDVALLAQTSVIFDITSNMRLAASLAGGTTPWAKTQLEGMLRFAYGWDVDFAREVAP